MTAVHLEYRPRWTVPDLEQIPPEFRAEIVYGELRTSPAPSKRHQKLILQLANQVDDQLPDGWMCVFDFDVVFSEDHSRRPDLGIVPRESIDVNPTPVGELALVAEVVSPGSENVDRLEKPKEYAEAGVPVYWRIETRGTLAVVAYELVGDTYLEHEPVTDTLTARQPWPLTIDVPELGRIGPKR